MLLCFRSALVGCDDAFREIDKIDQSNFNCSPTTTTTTLLGMCGRVASCGLSLVVAPWSNIGYVLTVITIHVCQEFMGVQESGGVQLDIRSIYYCFSPPPF